MKKRRIVKDVKHSFFYTWNENNIMLKKLVHESLNDDLQDNTTNFATLISERNRMMYKVVSNELGNQISD